VLVVLFYEVGGMDVCSAFPCVVTFQISLPLDEILKVFWSTEIPVCLYLFHLILFFIIDQIRWQSGEVWAV
jgi:hypothetical protein